MCADSPSASARRGRAVVIGGSVSGTLAARVLADLYREVLVVDRDKVLDVDHPRRGAPHAVHAHGLHARGYLILADLFPGLLADAQAVGLPVRDFGLMRWYFDAREVRRAKTGLLSIAGNRPVLENLLRRRVAALPNVTYRQCVHVTGLCGNASRERVTGVRLRGGDAGAAETVVDADLVVDATGRGSRTPVWLSELGYERPPEERLRIDLAYTTQMFRRRPGTFDGPQAINPVASPAHPRGAFFGQDASGGCRLSLTGILGDHPPTGVDAFLDYARSLPVPDVYEAIRDAEPASEPVSFTFPASVWRHYERLARLPEGLVAVGDAVCSFNPVYGQGMTVAAMQALVLREHLRRHPAVDARTLAREIGRVVRVPWAISTGGDLDFPAVVGPRPLRVRMRNAYLNRVRYAATKDPAVTVAFMRVTGLVDPPAALWRPRILARVLWLSRGLPAPAVPARMPRQPAGRGR